MRKQILYALILMQWHVLEDDGQAFPEPGESAPYQHKYAVVVNSGTEKPCTR